MFRFSAARPDNEASIQFPVGAKANEVKTNKRQITRNRTSYSCLTCRRRKVKCDKVHPVCGGCKKANEHCLYGQDNSATTISSSANASSEAWKDTSELTSKKRKTAPIRQESSTPVSTTSGLVGSVPSSQLKAIEEQLHRLTSMVDAVRQLGGNDIQLRNLLTPVPSGSDQDSGDMAPRPSTSLDMFQSKNQNATKDPTELSKPLSSLKLSNGDHGPENPFWAHISDELDGLNHLLRRRNNTYVSATNIQNKQCDRPQDESKPAKEEHVPQNDDFWDPTSFQKAAGMEVPDVYNPDHSCSLCRMMPFTKSSLLQNIPIRCSPLTVKRHLMKAIPSRAQSNVLFRCWLTGVYPIMPIFDPGWALKKNEAFWAQMESTGPDQSQYPDLDFFPLIHAIWYAGSLSISSKGLQRWFPNTSRAALASRFHDQVVFCLHLGSFTRNLSLQKLAAFILLHSLPVAEEEPIQGALYMQLAARLALTMGLHREPSLFGLSVAEEGMRRRLWWQIIQLDISLVVSSGYPSQISEAFCDTRINCEDGDSHFEDDGFQTAPSDRNSSNSSPNGMNLNGENGNLPPYRILYLVARAKSIIACALRSVISIHLSTKMMTNADMQEMKRAMHESHEQVSAIIKLIPARGLPELGFIPDGPKEGQLRALDCDAVLGGAIDPRELASYKCSGGDNEVPSPLARYHRQKLAAYNKWARISLSMMSDKIHCVAYAPFLKNTKSKLWSVGRQCALHNCHSFMRKFISLVTDPDLEPFRWSWPAMYGPMHAALIVLVDLYERPDSVEAPRSRELVDKVFSLSAPESGIVGGPNGVTVQRPMREGGVEAWDMLRGLRSAAWQKAGLDPTVLWTEADQLEIGIAAPLTHTQRIAQSLREDTIYENDRTSSNDNSTVKNPSPAPTSTDHGVRYMAKLAQSELANSGEEDGFPCSRAMRNQFLKDIENDARLNPNRGLRRREGQQNMPFPLSGCMEKCTPEAAYEYGPTGHMLEQMNLHIPRPATQSFSCGHHPESPFDAMPDTWAQSGIAGSAPPSHQTLLNNQALEKGTNERGSGTGHANGSNNEIHNHQNEEPHQSQSGIDVTLIHDDVPSTNKELGFDWERWDAVFGQYSGFTDLMEDVTWDEYVDEQ
ncbi:uncharacterized protein Z518_02498 [Rhinocladiella mackenziei CBS 650.93]|uniref:Zn(2)-C6 fungal-type domain-containing protein n=1 Tax=Rhinocladiella mackenziei CBS 650.93 TaxID=1442369 RepID=A0A0D2IPM3_9EURO|nr:uncharacterized protein Z518_02498 [Rhinocladiella mackenziei CBS 650.93]KIX07844.1 hypothetical protein Z518_02498 [Rhinocladiella mackenziei CBS 650.93]